MNNEQAPIGQGVRIALLTPEGRGALAVVGVAGEHAAAIVDRLFAARGCAVAARVDGAIAFGQWRSTGEDVVVVRHAADRVEVHCHGGVAASSAVLASLESAGGMPSRWEEWLDGGPCAREAREAIPFAVGPKPAMILCRQASGVLDQAIAGIEMLRAAGDEAASLAEARRLVALARVGLRLTRPWRVVLAGPVNAGKSSLMNALVGFGRSIVSEQPGTTRDVLTATTVLAGWPVQLVDVAGTRPAGAPASAVERDGIARALTAQDEADLVLRIVPADGQPPLAPPPPMERTLVVISKCDLGKAPACPGAIVTSAVTGMGLDTLIAAIVDRLVPEERTDPALLTGPVPFLPRHVDALGGSRTVASSYSSVDLPRR